ncbi:hypothetical protein D1007_11495 [Hordeum vulgare]|nr:hypothetical protein D1007_11495 [Hordeum vulgare]
MSKRPVEAGGERPPSRGRPASRSVRHHGASAQKEAQAAAAAAAVAAALRDDAAVSSRAAMAARPKRVPNEYVSYRQPGTSEASTHHHPGDERFPGGPSEASMHHRPGGERFPGGPGHGEIQEVDEPAQPPGGGRPYYKAPWQRRGRPPPEPLPPVAVDEPQYRYERVPGEQRMRMPGPAMAPRMGPRPTGNGGFRTNTTPVERVTTMKRDDGEAPYQGGAPVSGNGSPQQQHHDHQGSTSHTPAGGHHRTSGRRTPIYRSPDHEKAKRKLPALCFTLCCILFWLAVVVVGVAVLTVYLVYRPQPPKLRVTDASLNAGYVDELTVPGGPPRGLALNADLTVLTAITSPNTKINMVLWYMQLDVYFEGHRIGTATVLPAPLLEAPRTYALRTVDFVVSEVPLSRQDAIAWRNATAGGGPVVLKVVGKFHTQLNFGHWLPYKYWVYPRCTLWLDPPPAGRLLRARC